MHLVSVSECHVCASLCSKKLLGARSFPGNRFTCKWALWKESGERFKEETFFVFCESVSIHFCAFQRSLHGASRLVKPLIPVLCNLQEHTPVLFAPGLWEQTFLGFDRDTDTLDSA